jgi:phosphatidylserine/phosphatidylglycerophosphate/cardiolipin synthase-like enzyme
VRVTNQHALSDLTSLDRFASAPFPPNYDPNRRRFFSPVDDVHGVLVAVLGSATRSLVISMFGFDDDELAVLITAKLNAENVYVQLTLDSSQAGGVHERAILAKENYPASSVAVGRSEHGAIIHLKEAVIDGAIVVGGSTNWSTSGESLQDNEISVVSDPLDAAIVTARIGAIHANILAKAAK